MKNKKNRVNYSTIAETLKDSSEVLGTTALGSTETNIKTADAVINDSTPEVKTSEYEVPNTMEPEKIKAKVICKSLNFRFSPEIKDNVLLTISEDEEVTILNDNIPEKDWAFVKYANDESAPLSYTGYVMKEFIEYI